MCAFTNQRMSQIDQKQMQTVKREWTDMKSLHENTPRN